MFGFFLKKKREDHGMGQEKDKSISVYDWLRNKDSLPPGIYDLGNIGKLVIQEVFEPEYVDGVRSIKQRCRDEMDFMRDITYPGCEQITVVTEEKLEFEGVYFGYRCQHCNQYHVIRQLDIPKEVRQRVIARKHLESRSDKIVMFSNYQKRK